MDLAKDLYVAIADYQAEIGKNVTSKKGTIRASALSKRGDVAARAVVSPAPDVRLGQIEIPAYLTQFLVRTQVVTDANIAEITKMYDDTRIAYIKSIDNGVERHVSKYDLNSGRYTIKIGDIIARHLTDGDVVVLVRQPSLHKGSMLAFRAKIVHNRSTIGVFFGVTTSFGMDFDGDEGNLWVPQNPDTIDEVLNTMYSCRNIMNVRSSKPVIGIEFNALLSWYLYTLPEVDTKKILSIILTDVSEDMPTIDNKVRQEGFVKLKQIEALYQRYKDNIKKSQERTYRTCELLQESFDESKMLEEVRKIDLYSYLLLKEYIDKVIDLEYDEKVEYYSPKSTDDTVEIELKVDDILHSHYIVSDLLIHKANLLKVQNTDLVQNAINTLRRIEELRSQISLSYEEYSEKRLLMKEVYNNLMSDLYSKPMSEEEHSKIVNELSDRNIYENNMSNEEYQKLGDELLLSERHERVMEELKDKYNFYYDTLELISLTDYAESLLNEDEYLSLLDYEYIKDVPEEDKIKYYTNEPTMKVRLTEYSYFQTKTNDYVYNNRPLSKEEFFDAIMSIPDFVFGAQKKEYYYTIESFPTETYDVGTYDKLEELWSRCRLHGVVTDREQSKYSTRVLFSALLPRDFTYPSGGQEPYKGVLIKNGVLVEGTLTKAHLGAGQYGSIIHYLHTIYGWELTSEFISNCYAVGNLLIDNRGFSIGIKDCSYGKCNSVLDNFKKELEAAEIKAELLAEEYLKVKGNTKLYESKISDLVSNRMMQSATESVSTISEGSNNFCRMASGTGAGSKGDITNFIQTGIFVSQQFDGLDRIAQKVSGERCLTSQYCNDRSLTSRGLIDRSYAAGLTKDQTTYQDISQRESLTDTTMKTPESGAMARNLIMTMNSMTCNNGGVVLQDGTVVQFSYGNDSFHSEYLLGPIYFN